VTPLARVARIEEVEVEETEEAIVKMARMEKMMTEEVADVETGEEVVIEEEAKEKADLLARRKEREDPERKESQSQKSLLKLLFLTCQPRKRSFPSQTTRKNSRSLTNSMMRSTRLLTQEENSSKTWQPRTEPPRVNKTISQMTLLNLASSRTRPESKSEEDLTPSIKLEVSSSRSLNSTSN